MEEKLNLSKMIIDSKYITEGTGYFISVDVIKSFVEILKEELSEAGWDEYSPDKIEAIIDTLAGDKLK